MATGNDAAVEKRTRFFDGQFLQEEDFNVEQAYHLERQRRHRRLLHVAGVAEGLAVTPGEPNTVTVGPGTAIDSDGRLIVLVNSMTIDLPPERFLNKGFDLFVSYAESAEDRQTGEGSDDFTRWLERPQLTAVVDGDAWPGDTPPVLLARLGLDGNGRVSIVEGVRSYAGVRLPSGFADPPMLRAATSGEATLSGALTVTSQLRLSGDQQLAFSDGDTSNNLKVQLWTGYGLGINDGTLFYAANGRHSWRDDGGVNERMLLTTGEDGGLSVLGTGTSTFGGPLRISRHAGAPRGAACFLELHQDESERYGAEAVLPGIVFRHQWNFATTLEARPNAFHHLYEDGSRIDYAESWSGNMYSRGLSVGRFGPGLVGSARQRSTVDIQESERRGDHPRWVPGLYVTADLGETTGIEFRDSSGLEGIGFGLKTVYAAGTRPDQSLNLMPKGTGGVGIGKTDPWCALDVNGDIRANNIFVVGRMFFEPISNWGTEPEFGRSDQRRYWYFRRDNWNINNLAPGGVSVHASDVPFPILRREELSDVRLKDHISEISQALECVERLRGVRFDWNEAGLRHLTRDIEATTTIRPDATDDENAELWEELRKERYVHLDVPNIGLLAQDVEAVAPELVASDGEGYKSIDYARLSAILVEAVKELAAKVAALEGKEAKDA
jgi:hypothetical protein